MDGLKERAEHTDGHLGKLPSELTAAEPTELPAAA